MREGYILTAAFAEGLPAYEKQEQSLRFYFPELVKSIDLNKEDQRLAKITFANEPAVRMVKHAPPPPKPEPTGVFKTLEQAERSYEGRDLENAKAAYVRALKETDQKALQAKAYYGLARIAALEKNPELAESFFQKTIESSPEPQIEAWAHVYLGRLADARDDRTQATTQYQAALGISGASESAKRAAQAGLRDTFRKGQQPQP